MGGRNWGLTKYVISILFIALAYNQCTVYRSIGSFSVNFPSATRLIPGLFKIERKTIMVLPYNIRLNKLKNLVGSQDPALYAKLESQKVALGSYDFAKGISPDLTWTDARLTAWTLALQPICASTTLNQKFPFPASAAAFIESAYGRPKNSNDQSMIDGINATTVTNPQKLELLCYTVLSSLEFVAQ
jgi:hypothetical protein